MRKQLSSSAIEAMNRPIGWGGRRALLIAALGATLLSSHFAVAQIAFTDVSHVAGVDRAGESYGASWGDLNGDGYPDLFASNHREQPSLFLNMRNGTFYETAPQVLTWRNQANADTHGGSWSDFDNDGDLDLLVSSGTGNLSQLLVNEHQRLVNRTQERGLTTTNLGGRLPVWFDYDGDKLIDFVMTQYGGIAKLYHQGPKGFFTETTSSAKLLCVRFHYGQLIDVNGDGHLDFLCSDEELFPQKVYNTEPLPWQKIYDNANPARYLPPVATEIDSVLADFNNDGRMDMFVLGGGQLRPSSVAQSSDQHFEASLMNGIKGFRFTSTGKVTFSMDWNRKDEGSSVGVDRIEIGAKGAHPAAVPFTLDPANTAWQGMPAPPKVQTDIPTMQIGYNATTHQWTLILWAQLSETAPNVFSEAYVQVDSSSTITALAGTGLWPSDKPSRPTLLTNYAGGFVDETVKAGLDEPLQCVSGTAGDFDNDMYVDLYLACRTGASNIANILYENLHDGTFRKVTDAGGAAGPIGVAIASGAGTADSVVQADYNVDGFLDLFVTNGFNLRPLRYGGPNKLFRNQGNGNHWVEIDLVGTQSERDATGARVYATANGVTQMRIQNGGYHRWSQDIERSHFGLAGASAVTLRVEWPNGGSQTFTNVAANKLYRITEGSSVISPVALGVAPVYQCGPPPLNAAVDQGVFLWRDCPSGEWRLKTAAGGGAALYGGTISSSVNFTSVKGVALSSADSLNTTDPRKIVFKFDTRGKATDGVNFIPKDGATTCIKIDTPVGSKIVFGPFRKPLTPPFNLETQEPCTP